VDRGEEVHFVICKVRRYTAYLADCKRERQELMFLKIAHSYTKFYKTDKKWGLSDAV